MINTKPYKAGESVEVIANPHTAMTAESYRWIPATVISDNGRNVTVDVPAYRASGFAKVNRSRHLIRPI